MIVAPGATSVSVDVQFLDDSGYAVTGKVASDFPACKWSGGTNAASTTITLSDLAAITTAHPNDNTAGGIKEREGGWYRLDLPNNVFTAAGRKTLTFAETTNKRIVAPPLDCQYVQGDVQTIKTQAVTCAAGVTIRADVGAAAAPGAANGMLISGSNAATTFAGLTTGALSCTTITASGAVAFQSTFVVTTSTSLAALSATTVTFSGAVAFQSTFVVSTSTNLAALSCSTFAASGTVTFNAFTCTNNFTVSGNWLTTGTTTWTGAAAFSAGLTSNITGTVSGNATAAQGAHLDADVSSRMATYTQPTGFLATTFGTTVGDATAANQSTINTNVLTRLATSGYTAPDNANIATIVAKTNSLTFTNAGILDVNILYVHNVQVKGTGTSGDPWNPV